MAPKCPNIPDHVAYAKIRCCHIPSKVKNIEYKARWRRHTGRNVSYEYKYNVSSTELERVDVKKDLGVLFDSVFSFVSHCKQKINRAYSMLGVIKRNFIYLTEEAFVTLYKSSVRCYLEYAN